MQASREKRVHRDLQNDRAIVQPLLWVRSRLSEVIVGLLLEIRQNNVEFVLHGYFPTKKNLHTSYSFLLRP